MRITKLLIALLAIILTYGHALAFDTWSGKVVGVSDGDTITVMHDGKSERIRLWGVDCPEKSQAFGQRAKQFTSSKTFGKTAKIEVHDVDRYGRTVGQVFIDGKSLNEDVVRSGMAWVYHQYCSGDVCGEWGTLEQAARESKTGLWSDPNPVAPWVYRHSGKPSHSISYQAKAKISTGGNYHGNIESRKFHAPGCRYYGCEKCIAMFKGRQAAINAGYTPCMICKS